MSVRFDAVNIDIFIESFLRVSVVQYIGDMSVNLPCSNISC